MYKYILGYTSRDGKTFQYISDSWYLAAQISISIKYCTGFNMWKAKFKYIWYVGLSVYQEKTLQQTVKTII